MTFTFHPQSGLSNSLCLLVIYTASTSRSCTTFDINRSPNVLFYTVMLTSLTLPVRSDLHGFYFYYYCLVSVYRTLSLESFVLVIYFFSLNTFTHRLFSEMELDCKFEIATSCLSVSLGSLEPDRPYPIVHAERVTTRYGQSVLVAIMDSPRSSVKFFSI